MRIAIGGVLFALVTISLAGANPANDEGEQPKKQPEMLPEPRKTSESKGEGKASTAEGPTFRIVLGPRQGSTLLNHFGVSLIHGGTIEVQQPRPDIVIIILTGATAVAGIPCGESLASIVFDVVQEFQIQSTDPKVIGREAQLLVEGQLVGMLRRSRPGKGVPTTAPPAHAVVEAAGHILVEFGFGERTLEGQDKVYVNDHFGPVPTVVPCCVPLLLHEKFGILCDHPPFKLMRNCVYASFGPSPSRWPEWVRLLDPAPEVAQGDLGFRVILRVEPLPFPRHPVSNPIETLPHRP